jgi:hypothetical protein
MEKKKKRLQKHDKKKEQKACENVTKRMHYISVPYQLEF